MLPKPVCLALLLLSCGMLACSTPTAPDSPRDSDVTPILAPSEVATVLVDLTNAERNREGLASLRPNARLMQADQIQADQMERLGRLDHVLPEAAYPRLDDRLAAVSYRWQAAGENVAYGYRSPEEAVGGWMQSPSHRASILNSVFTEIGTGYVRDASGRPYYVQVFGRPLS